MIESIKEGLKNIIPRMEGYKTNLVNISSVCLFDGV